MATAPTPRTKVFISYSHRDRDWLVRLQVHLKPLEREGRLERWDDNRIRAGTRWREEIERALAEAKVAVLLISADFLASDFIAKNELPPLLARAETDGVEILQVIVGPSLFEEMKNLSQFQPFNDPRQPLLALSENEQEKIWVQVARTIKYKSLISDGWVREWLSPEQREFLENLFQTPPISKEELRAWCHETLPSNIPFTISRSADLLEWLIEKGQLSNGQVPLLGVLQKLLPFIVEANLRNSLEQCISQTARHFGIAERQPMPESAPVGTEDIPALMLKIEPTAPSGKRCNVQGWLYFSSQRVFTVCVREKENALNFEDEEELRSLVEELRTIIGKYRVNPDNVIVEFILPHELLSEAVEQWTNKIGNPHGIDWPIVVRSLERLQRPGLQIHWEERWMTLIHGKRTVLGSLDWLEESQEQWRQIGRKLSDKGCIALGFVPDLCAPREQNALHHLLYEGAPAALWPRRKERLADLPTQLLKTFSENQPIKELPRIIRDMRRCLWEYHKETDPCYHITLLWDDPNRRIPPKPQNDDEFLQAPI